MKLINDVLVKLIKGGSVDQVMILDNVPEDMFYKMAFPRIAVGKGQENHWEPDQNAAKVLTLHDELSLSQTGDGAIVFDMENENAIDRFKALDRYIRQMWPANKAVPEFKPNSEDPTDSRARPLLRSDIPRAVLPVLSPPTGALENPSKVADVAGTNEAALILDVEKIKAEAIAEYEAKLKEAAKEKMAKARAAKVS